MKNVSSRRARSIKVEEIRGGGSIMTRKTIARESDGDINSCQEDIIKKDNWKATEEKGQKKKETTSKKTTTKTKTLKISGNHSRQTIECIDSNFGGHSNS
ncbi:hypothetical protein RND71_012471 [Anisodus tanguticus]|uniref:Uncharacterized protein n=1 Tax=Anisodus tanguticus TaxID=243964 RepID=A0AAE1VPU1_9SOLA|nr:hypothetical protein RND71_012471 [Anisodus tanguticus]